MADDIDSSNPAAQEIVDTEQRRRQAYLDRDFEALRDIVADRVVYVHSYGKTDDKETYLANVVNVPDYISLDRKDVRLRFLDSDTAVMSGWLLSRFTRDGGPEKSTRTFLTQIWERGTVGWQLRLHELTKID